MKKKGPGSILRVIRGRYKIPFLELRTPKISSNNSSALKVKQFVNEGIAELLQNKCVEQLDTIPDFVNP